ncbi:hypothetical protein Cgig2_023904 [Carnegiea gigantea]|uniref:Uncharacterized protein n=1 Tax=Carnegiea gigantea TaxID=171969 RepID=A0A9Q1GHK2_9CARY|nr:hypothetical protein Cgig2_023399 [Carnegiea gigantea]KAJ8425488.1 hypothetical protein Cgig2_023904 [Carnegiea gigantea]
MASITLLDLHQYHHVDRSLFARMVMQLSRDPAEALLAMAYWFWLEDNNFPCLVTSLLGASDFIVNKVVDEAIICLNSLAANQGMPPITNTCFTTAIMESNVPLDVMHRDKSLTVSGIKNFLKRVCARIFTDILRRVTARNRTARIRSLCVAKSSISFARSDSFVSSSSVSSCFFSHLRSSVVPRQGKTVLLSLVAKKTSPWTVHSVDLLSDLSSRTSPAQILFLLPQRFYCSQKIRFQIFKFLCSCKQPLKKSPGRLRRFIAINGWPAMSED